MSLSPLERREFEDLMHALCEDLLDGAGTARISELLAKHEDAQVLYIEALSMHADLAWDYRERGGLSPPDVSVTACGRADSAVEEPRRVSPALAFLGDIRVGNLHLPVSPTTFWMLLAMLLGSLSLVLVCVLATRGVGKPDIAKVPFTSPADSGEHREVVGTDAGKGRGVKAVAVARLTRTAECHWGGEVSPPELGASLVAGQKIDLSSGAFELVFDVGVRSVIQGPARLDLVAPGRVLLHTGKMTSEILRPEARGFEVQTSKGSVIDLGTEFGVEVTPSQYVAVHVFQGEVLVERPAGPSETACRQQLRGEEGLRIEGGLSTPWLVKEPGENFMRTIDDAERNPHVVAYWRFEDQPLGSVLPDTMHNTKPVRATVDSSFNGNDLYTYSVEDRPTFVRRVPSVVVPQTGSPNRFCLDTTDEKGIRNVYTHSEFSHAAPLDLQKIAPSQWTIEASVNVAKLGEGVQTFVGRDTYYTLRDRPEPPRLAFQINSQRRFAITYYDVADRRHEAIAEGPVVETNRWYHVAATSDGRTLRLYVDILDGRGYLLRASADLPAQGSTALGKGADDAEWSIGRGRNGTDPGQRFHGLIDEVRLSDVALSPSGFLFAPKVQGKH
jgi:hypothetical protein